MIKLTQEELEALKRTARNDIIWYSCWMDRKYDPQEFHQKIARALERVAKWELKRLMISIPPRGWKSKLTAVNLPGYLLWLNPSLKIVTAWYWQMLTDQFSREAQLMVASPEYKELFPETKLNKTNVQHRETDKGGYYHSVGIWWPLTWFWFDVGIIDDPVKDREEAESFTIREKIWNWYTSVFSTRKMDENAAVIVIMTRRHVDDLAWRLEKLEREGGEKREKIVIPALDENNNSFWPSKFSTQYLLWLKQQIGVRDFAALYMQDPIMSTWAIFKPSDFRYFQSWEFEKATWPLRKKDITMWIFIDPAFSTSKQSDDAVVMVAGQHNITKEIYLFDIYADTAAPSATIEAMFWLALRWELAWYPIAFISCEDVKINKDQTQFRKTLHEEMQKRNKFYSIYEFKPRAKKEDRIRLRLEPFISNHQMNFIKGHWDFNAFRKLEEQLTLFPNSRKDDVIDCLAQVRQVFAQRWQPKQSKKQRQFFNALTGKMQSI